MKGLRVRRLGLILGAYAGFLAPAWSAEKVTILAYTPVTGVEHVYRVEKATVNALGRMTPFMGRSNSMIL